MGTENVHAVVQWIISRYEPLVSDEYRLQAREGLRERACADRRWFDAWVAGVLSDLVLSLDPHDPWRNTTQFDGVVTLPDGQLFGRWRNATDVIPATPAATPAQDLSLAALAEPLSPSATQLWHRAQHGSDPARQYLNVLPLQDAFPAAEAALCWAMFRRRVFTGMEDAFIPLTAQQWAERAHQVAAGTAWDEAGAARVREGNRIEPGSWAQLT